MGLLGLLLLRRSGKGLRPAQGDHLQRETFLSLPGKGKEVRAQSTATVQTKDCQMVPKYTQSSSNIKSVKQRISRCIKA